jgi:HEAT repeat protein
VATAAERRLLAGIGGGLFAGAMLLLLAVPSMPPAPARAVAIAATPLASAAPRTRPSEVAALVAACSAATAAELSRLRQLAASGDPLVAGNAIRALGRMRAVHQDGALLQRLGDPAPRVRHELIAALGQCGDPTAVRRLEPLLYAKDQQSRYLAIQALVQLHASEPLQRLLQNPGTDASTRAFAQAAGAPLGVPSLLATTASLPDR